MAQLDSTLAYTLQEAGEADYDWLRRLLHAAMRESVEQIWGWDETWQDTFFREHFDRAGLQIIQVEGRDAGVLEVEERPHDIYVVDIQISPAFQGRGIGSAVIQRLQRRPSPGRSHSRCR